MNGQKYGGMTTEDQDVRMTTWGADDEKYLVIRLGRGETVSFIESIGTAVVTSNNGADKKTLTGVYAVMSADEFYIGKREANRETSGTKRPAQDDPRDTSVSRQRQEDVTAWFDNTNNNNNNNNSPNNNNARQPAQAVHQYRHSQQQQQKPTGQTAYIPNLLCTGCHGPVSRRQCKSGNNAGKWFYVCAASDEDHVTVDQQGHSTKIFKSFCFEEKMVFDQQGNARWPPIEKRPGADRQGFSSANASGHH